MSDPREILPVEVWEVILNFVDDPQDIQSCSQTCTLFRNHLSPTQTTWAFPLIFPSVMKFLPRSDVLGCRLVSKDWLNGVDTFLQSNKYAPSLVGQLRNHKENLNSSFITRISHNQRPRVNNNDLNPPGNQFPHRFREYNRAEPNPGVILDYEELLRLQRIRINQILHQNMNQGQNWELELPLLLLVQDAHQIKLKKFMSSFENNAEKNPFPSRALVLFITDFNFESTILLLTKFGCHVRSLKLCFQLTEKTSFQLLQLIWDIVRIVPNLKHLLIEELPGHSIGPMAVQHDVENFTTFLETTATPVLNQLKWIEMAAKSWQSIQNILVKAYHNRSVTIFEHRGFIKPIHLNTGAWKHLSFQFERQFSSRDWKQHVRSFKLLNLPLESVDLQYFKCEDFESIFDGLSKYGSTLRRARLTFTNLQSQELVEMRKDVDAIYISFLSQMKNLEDFNMVFDCVDSGRTIEFRQFIDAILDAGWIKDYLEMGGGINGFRRFGYACISAGLKMKADRSTQKLKYFTDGKYFRSMEVISSESI